MTKRDSVIAWLMGKPKPAAVEKRDGVMSWAAYQALFTFNGNQYPYGVASTKSYLTRAMLESCGPAFAVLDRRSSIIGEARPSFQRFAKGAPTDLFSTRELDILKQPWLSGSWRLLTSIMEADVAACGNSYWVRLGGELVRLDPDWVTLVVVEVVDRGVKVGSRLVGYAVQAPTSEPAYYEVGEVAHYRPATSTSSPWRGESWLAAVSTDAGSDVEMTRYKANYLRNGALPSIAVTYEPTIDQAQLEAFVPLFAEKFTGAMNAGKVMHFLGGRDVKTVGATLDQLAFKAVQGAGETRIAAAAGVPAVVAGFSEGMQGSSLNAGNYQATRRLFADAKIRPLLGHVCEALSALVPPPVGARLWYDDSQVSFFQEDVADEANIRQQHAITIRTLIDAGYEPDAAVAAVMTGDFTALTGTHTGLFSVQLQPPTNGTSPTPPALPPA